MLHRWSVAADTHEVKLIVEGKPARVRILTEAGDVVFDCGVTGGVGPVEGSPSAELEAGLHLVECALEGGTPTTVPLEVGPCAGRPGLGGLTSSGVWPGAPHGTGPEGGVARRGW